MVVPEAGRGGGEEEEGPLGFGPLSDTGFAVLELDPFDALALSLHHSPGSLALLVGSGLSRAAGIPTGWEITLDLVRRYAALKGVASAEDWAKWYQQETGRAPNYSELLDALASTASERRDILESYIEPSSDDEEGVRLPTKAHHAIARLVAQGRVKVLVTTNFDRLLENALRDAGVEPTVIAHDDALAGAPPIVHARCTLIKVHGDYMDSRIKNTDQELETYSPAMNTLLDEVFDRFGLLSVGWSGEWDTALRGAILRAPGRRYPFYWAARGEPAARASDLIAHRQGRTISISDADSLFTRLEQTLLALEAAARPHPVSVAMAVALAKRYCRDDALAMEWTELLAAEATKIRAFVTGEQFHPGSPDDASLNDLVERIFAETEVLRRLCLVAGRWGGAEARKAVVRMLRDLQCLEASSSQYVYVIAMRAMAASLCFNWYLFGCAAGERWGAAVEVLRARILINGAETAFASVLPLAAYREMQWNFLDGFDRRYTPASDFLVPRIKAEISDIVVSGSEMERLFDEVELLIALEATHQRLAWMKQKDSSSFWVPTGRFSWREMHGALSLDGVIADPARHPWTAAGLAGGLAEDVKAAAEKLKAYVGARSHF